MASTTSIPAGVYRIIDAALSGDIVMLKQKRAEIGDEGKFRRMCDSETDRYGFKVLHIAAKNHYLDMCRFLLEEVGVDIDAITYRGDTPLLIALKGGHAVIAKYLIERGADVTMTGDGGFTALHWAVPKRDTEIMTLLLTKGADIHADSVAGKPLHYAALFGIADIVKFLLENKAKPNSFSKYLCFSPLVCAIHSDKNPIECATYYNTNTFDCVELLLKADADPNKPANGFSPLAHAIVVKSNSCIRSLLEAGADVDEISSCGLRPIELAALEDNREAIWMLIEARPRILATPNWSFFDLMNSINSVEAKQRRFLYSRRLMQNGDDAWDKQDYSSAITSYSEAKYQIPKDENLFSNRSLCWARMGEGVYALRDAERCVKLKPGWVKAHVREAIAWHLLKRYRMSADAFKRAYELAPENDEIER